MTYLESSGYDIDAEKRRAHDVVRAGTGDLLKVAVDVARPIINDLASAEDFLTLYSDVVTYREAHGGELPDGIFPPKLALIDAIDALKAARVQNIMSHPGLSDSHQNDRQAAANSYLVIGTYVEVIQTALVDASS